MVITRDYAANRHIVNVRNFGAKGDGVTDDTEAIQNAIDSAAVNGGVVYLPTGIYLVSEPGLNMVAMDSRITGDGIGQTILQQSGPLETLLAVLPNEVVEGVLAYGLADVSGITFTCDTDIGVTAVTYFVKILNADPVLVAARFEDCEFDRPNGACFFIESMGTTEISGCFMNRNGPAKHIIANRSPLTFSRQDLYTGMNVYRAGNRTVVPPDNQIGGGTGSGEVVTHDAESLNTSTTYVWTAAQTFTDPTGFGTGFSGSASLTVGVDKVAEPNRVPMKFEVTFPPPTIVVTTVPGAVETDGIDLYWTNSAGSRKKIALVP